MDWDLLNPLSWSEHTLRVLTALGTVGAVIALVVVETTKGALGRWREWRRRPVLTLTHNPQVDVAREVIATATSGLLRPTRPTAYARLGVENAPGRRAAPAVEVVVKKVERVDAGAPGSDPPTHDMGPLGWTHRDPLLNQLGPGARRTVVLGALPSGGTTLQVGLGIGPPLSGVDVLQPGTYRFVLTVSAENVDARDWIVELWHDGQFAPASRVPDHVKITKGPAPI
jgi:hypothetical protein